MAQGTTLNNDEECCSAAHAIDGDLSTMAATVSDNGAGWLKLGFGRTRLINKIIIYYMFYTNWYNSKHWCVRTEQHFIACIEKNNNVDVSVYQGEVQQKSCGTLQLTYGLEQSDQIYTLICNTEGDTVKLTKTAHREAIAVFEVVVISSLGT